MLTFIYFGFFQVIYTYMIYVSIYNLGTTNKRKHMIPVFQDWLNITSIVMLFQVFCNYD